MAELSNEEKKTKNEVEKENFDTEKELENKSEKNKKAKKEKKEKAKHHMRDGAIRITALIIALLMIFAVCASLVFYLVYANK